VTSRQNGVRVVRLRRRRKKKKKKKKMKKKKKSKKGNRSYESPRAASPALRGTRSAFRVADRSLLKRPGRESFVVNTWFDTAAAVASSIKRRGDRFESEDQLTGWLDEDKVSYDPQSLSIALRQFGKHRPVEASPAGPVEFGSAAPWDVRCPTPLPGLAGHQRPLSVGSV